jgi:hypothetical protein
MRSMSAVAQALPEGFAVGAGADGRGALEGGGAVGDVFGGEVEVVRAAFRGDGQAFGAGGGEQRQGERGAEVDDVDACAVLAAEVNHEADGGELGLVGARGEVGGVAAPVRVGIVEGVDGGVDGLGEFGVDEQRQAGLGDGGEGALELFAVDHGEALAAGIDEEALEAGDAGAGEGKDVGLVIGDGSTPCGPVDEALVGGGGALGFEGGDGGGFGEAVEGHVDEGGVASGGGGASGGGEALPLGAAGLVDVDVGVDEAGEDGEGAEVVDGGVGGQVGWVADGADEGVGAVVEKERGAACAGGCDDAIGEEGMCHNRYYPLSNWCECQ